VDEQAVLMQAEALIRAVLRKPPSSANTSDSDWARLFHFCEDHRYLLAARVSARRKATDLGYLDLWLRQLASPPRGQWASARLSLLSLIRVAGIPPRIDYEPMFTASESD
jgi:hypothetical protein